MMMNVEPGTETEVKTSYEILHDTGASKGKVTDSLFQGVECDPNKNSGSKTKTVRCFLLKPGDSVGDFDYGRVRVFCQNVPAALVGKAVGRLSVSYKVLFHKERLFNSVGRNGHVFHSICGFPDGDSKYGKPAAAALTATNVVLDEAVKLNQKNTFSPVITDSVLVNSADAYTINNATVGVSHGKLETSLMKFCTPYGAAAQSTISKCHSIVGVGYGWLSGTVIRTISIKFPPHMQGVYEVNADLCFETSAMYGAVGCAGLVGNLEFVSGWARRNEQYGGDYEWRGPWQDSGSDNYQAKFTCRIAVGEQQGVVPELILNVGEIETSFPISSTNRQVDIKIRQVNDLDRVSAENGRPLLMNKDQSEIVTVV